MAAIVLLPSVCRTLRNNKMYGGKLAAIVLLPSVCRTLRNNKMYGGKLWLLLSCYQVFVGHLETTKCMEGNYTHYCPATKCL